MYVSAQSCLLRMQTIDSSSVHFNRVDALKRRAVELARRADAWNDYCHLWREREKHFLEKEVEAYRQMTHQQNDQFNGGDDQDSNEGTDLMETPRVYEDAVADIVKEKEPEKTIAIVGEEKSLEIEADDALDLRAYDVHIDHGPKSSQKLNGTKTQSDQNRSGSECSVGLPPVSSNSKSSLRISAG
ncbi:hypothetical protein Tco_0332425 [Tanacetum coccineum]